MQQAEKGEEGDRFVSCGLRALPGGSAGTGATHTSPQPPAVPIAVPHTQEQHRDLPTTPPVWDPRCHLNIQEGQKWHRAPS